METKLKNIETIMNAEEGPDETDKFEMFNKWCQEQGVIMPKIEYPAFFDGGLIGMRCKEEVKHREAYIFIPLKMVMSIGKAIIHPVVGRIIRENK